jgi:hypothetical protein
VRAQGAQGQLENCEGQAGMNMFNVIEFRRAKVKQFMADARLATSPKHRRLLVQRARIVHHKMLKAKG